LASDTFDDLAARCGEAFPASMAVAEKTVVLYRDFELQSSSSLRRHGETKGSLSLKEVEARLY